MLFPVMLELGELTIDQLPGATGARGSFGSAFTFAFNRTASLATKSESPGLPASGPVGGIAAKLSIPKKTPAKQRLKADNARTLKRPDWELGFFISAFLLNSSRTGFVRRSTQFHFLYILIRKPRVIRPRSPAGNNCVVTDYADFSLRQGGSDLCFDDARVGVTDGSVGIHIIPEI